MQRPTGRERRYMRTTKKAEALAALLTTTTQKEAAAKAGISCRTLSTYLADLDFRRQYEEELQKIAQSASAKLKKYMSEAVDVLHTTATSEDTGATARVAAARALLDYGLKVSEMDDLRGKLEELEERMKG